MSLLCTTHGCSHTVGISSKQKPERNQVHRIVPHRRSIRPLTNERIHRSHSSSGNCPERSRALAERRTLMNAQRFETLGGKLLKSLEQRRVDSEQSVSSRAAPRQPSSHEDVSRSEFFVEASLDGLGKVETTQRNHFETKRLAVVVLGTVSEVRFLKRTIRWV